MEGIAREADQAPAHSFGITSMIEMLSNIGRARAVFEHVCEYEVGGASLMKLIKCLPRIETQISSERVCMINARASRKLLHTGIILVEADQVPAKDREPDQFTI